MELTIYTFDFKSKLHLLNPSLFINDARATSNEFFASSGIYINTFKRSRGADYNYLESKESREFLEATDKGQVAEFLCAIPQNFIPKYDLFNTATGKLWARGWRSTLTILNQKGRISLDKARRIFDCYGLGTDDYDKLTFAQKLDWARGNRYPRKPSISSSSLPLIENFNNAE